MTDRILDELTSTREFWDANPCGVHQDYLAQRDQRYAMEPWLPQVLASIAKTHSSILEVGCGQGIDSTELCSAMSPGGRYQGIDYSPASVAVASRNAQSLAEKLAVRPDYQVGNAEALEFPDGSFGAVYSMGVLHHTADEDRAIKEIHRVLETGGAAYIFLYRRGALKVAVAQWLRRIQAALDALLGTDRGIYRLLRRLGSHNRWFGTMFLECFGVPYLKSYNEEEIRALFSAYSSVELLTTGASLGRLAPKGQTTSPTSSGYFWFVTAQK